MKVLSLVILSLVLSTACSHHKKDCCSKKTEECKDGSCSKDKKKS